MVTNKQEIVLSVSSGKIFVVVVGEVLSVVIRTTVLSVQPCCGREVLDNFEMWLAELSLWCGV